jgi:hypothetical protein
MDQIIRLLDLRLHLAAYRHIMETEQMMSRLQAEIRTGKEHMKKMTNEMKDEINEDMNANRKTDREGRKAEMPTEKI